MGSLIIENASLEHSVDETTQSGDSEAIHLIGLLKQPFEKRQFFLVCSKEMDHVWLPDASCDFDSIFHCAGAHADERTTSVD